MIYLGTIRKAQFNEEIRKKQVAFQLQQMESEEKKREEKEKKMELAADFNFAPVFLTNISSLNRKI